MLQGMDSTLERAPAVVVGGGLAGLTTAAYLARNGQDVTLYERSPILGGRAATQVHDGFAFNRGIHALYTGGAASEVLRDLGVTYTAGTPTVTLALDHGKLIPLPTGPLSLLRSPLLGVPDKLEFLRLLAGLPRVSARDLAHVSVQQWIDRNLRRPWVRRLVTALARTFVDSTALDLVSADVFIDKLQRS
jgi:phytoene dehydrogenase-like protein